MRIPYINPMESDPSRKEDIGIVQSIKILWWVLKVNFQVSPFLFVIFSVSKILQELRGIVYAYLFAVILDELISIASQEDAKLEDMYTYLGILFIYRLSIVLLNILTNYSRVQLSTQARLRIKMLFYKKIYALGVETLEDPDIANNLHRGREAIGWVSDYLERILNLVGAIVRMISTGLIIIAVMPIMLPLLMLSAIPSLINERYFIKKDWKFHLANTEYDRKSRWDASYLMESKNIKEIQITKAFEFIHRRFQTFTDFWIRGKTSIRRPWYASSLVLDSFGDFVIIGGYAMTFSRLIKGTISVGDTTFFVSTFSSFDSAFKNSISRFTDLYEASLKLNDVKQLFDHEPIHKDGTHSIGKLTTPPRLEIQNVSFSYPSNDVHVLKNINLEINSGEKIAIVGENGAGKTTLVKLLSKLYQPTSGQILVNSINLNEVSQKSWFENLGALFQDFNGYSNMSALENIQIGDPYSEFDMNRIIEAAKKADAYDFIQEYKYGFDQILSEKFEGGIRPSHGQWQKIAIARFFYRNSPVLIFDEPTAAIDAVSEAKIFNRIYEFFDNKTVIIISHRFSTVRNADRIIVMHEGAISEQGTHEELMSRESRYRRAFNLQAEGYS